MCILVNKLIKENGNTKYKLNNTENKILFLFMILSSNVCKSRNKNQSSLKISEKMFLLIAIILGNQ